MNDHNKNGSLPDIHFVVNKAYSVDFVRNGASFIHPISASESIRRSLYGPHRTESWSDYATVSTNKFLNYLKQVRQDYCPVPYLSSGEPYKGHDYFVKTDTYIDLTWRLLPAEGAAYIPANYVLVGPRGSGKTLTQNCWISEHHDELEKQKIFWVRCDAPKLYQLWLSGKIVAADDNFPSLSEYHDIQLIYVFAKNLQKRKPFFVQMFELIGDAAISESPAVFGQKGIQKNLREFVLDIGQMIENDEIGKPRTYSTAVDTILRVPGVAATQKKIWQAASNSLQAILHENGYTVLKILDGLDNVDCQNTEMLKWYRKFATEAADFVFHSDAYGRRVIKLLTARNGTWSDIDAISYAQLDRHDDVIPVVLRHVAPKFSKVMHRRALVIREKSPPPADCGVTWSTDDKKAIVSLAGDKIFMVADSGDRTDLNLKAWIRNRLNLVGHLYYRSLQTGQPIGKISYAKKPESRRYLFLNDRFFIDSHTSRRSGRVETGFVFPNPFYLGEPEGWDGNLLNWDGLMAIRVLQAVSALGNHRGVTWGDVIRCLDRLFGYKRNRLEQALDVLKDHSLVETESDRGYVTKTYETLDDLSWREGLKLKSNALGRSFPGIVFSNPDCLYFLALDTFLPASILEHGFIISHNNGFSETSPNPAATRFPSSAIISSTAFLRFVLDVEREEVKRATAALEAPNCELCKGLSISSFTLPIHNPYTWKAYAKGIEFLYNAATEPEQKVIRDKLDKMLEA